MSSSSTTKEEAVSFSNPTSSSSSTTTTTTTTSLPITMVNTDTTATTNNIIHIGIGSGSGSGSFQSDNPNNPVVYDYSYPYSYDADVDVDVNLDVEVGYSRPDFRRNPLVGTVQFYDRHVFLCYKNPLNWPPSIQASDFDRLPRLLSASLSARKSTIPTQTRLTICEGRDGTETSNGDVLLFPDMIRYRRLTHFDVDTFVEEVLIKGGEWTPGNPEKLKGFYVFICCHGSRDRHCGVCGPPLVTRFKEEVESHGLHGKVSVSPCSHVGGHKYAGNVLIFGPSIEGEVTGHWYGYVTPEDVPTLLEQHIMKGEIIEWLWRGQMGMSEDDQRRAQELRLQNSKGADAARSIRSPSDQLPEIYSPTQANACCPTNSDTTTCCQQSTFADNFFFDGDAKVAAATGRKAKKQLSRNNSYKRVGNGKRKVCGMPSWIESWENEDTYAVLAVMCAAVSVGIAYCCYKQL